ncbi:MAG: thioredoxin family protein [Bdellovibrionales bacterium]|nr:thioredoxin family protein [Bdellovibrionales bacterium]
MTSLAPYQDARAQFFRDWFERGASYESYLATGTPEQLARWRAYEAQLTPDTEQLERLRGFRRQMNVLVLSGIWCGDCMRQGPMLRLIEQTAPAFTVRWLDNKANPELQNELRINGAEKVPVVVTLSEDFFELSRFGDRHLSVYRRKAATEFGTACDPGIVGPSAEELRQELEEWIAHFERPQLMLRLAPLLRKRYAD